MSTSTVSSSTSFLHAASRCFAWSFGIFAGLIFLYHYGLSIVMFGSSMIVTMISSWWNYIQQLGSLQGYVFGGLIATASTLLCISFKIDQYAPSINPRNRLLFCRTLLTAYIFSYIHIGLTCPTLQPPWNNSVVLLSVIYVLIGIFSTAFIYVCTFEEMQKLNNTTPSDDDSSGKGTSSTQTPAKTPTFIELDETWEQRFARQAAERRRNAQKSS